MVKIKRRNIKCIKERKKAMKMAQEANNPEPQKQIQVTQEQLDIIVIDITLRELFNNGDKKIIDFKKDVIEKYSIPADEPSIERYWDILDATQMVNPVVGFGNAHKLSLNSQGYNLMLQYGNYQNYINTMIQQTQGQIIDEDEVQAPEIKPAQQAENPAPPQEAPKEVKRKRDDKTF